LTTELILKPRQLTIADIGDIVKLGHVENDILIMERSPKGYKLKTPTRVQLERILAVGQKGLLEYIIHSLISERPLLIPWVLENQSLIRLARHFLRSQSGSLMGFYVYANTIHQYSSRLGYRPDEIIADLASANANDYSARVKKHRGFLEDCLAELQDQKRSPGRIHGYAKHVRTFYHANEIEIPRPDLPRPMIVRKDRAPKPEELERLLDVADLREKVIVSMMALGGFREGTLIRLQYRHVKEDLEKGIAPIHVHVESEITKGKYHDYDTFLGSEAVELLRLYLDSRRQGSPNGKLPPETISDDAALIRDSQSQLVKPIGERQLYQLVHALYFKAGLLKQGQNGGYDLRVHSLRKYFKTQLMALGVQGDYVDYMMGHTVSTYHDIQSKGIEWLRNIYASAGLSIRPRTNISKIEMVKEFARGLGLNPEEILVQKAFSEPETKYLDPQEKERADIRALMQAIKADLLKTPGAT